MDAMGARAGEAATMKQEWCIITCEYPPLMGGVSDHTFRLAGALADAGDSVDVWTPPGATPPPPLPGVSVHLLPSLFGFDALRALRRMLNELPLETRVLVQYVPTGYGWRMMNVGFAWLLFTQRARGLDIYVHEVGFNIPHEPRIRRKLAGLVHIAMSWLSMSAAAHVFVAIPEWANRLRASGVGSGRRAGTVTWIPVPSNVPDVADPLRVATIRESFAAAGATTIVGHFGTFGRYHSTALPPAIARVLDDAPDRGMLLIGRHGGVMRDSLITARPDLGPRIQATGGVSSEEVSAHISACDVLIQPFDDGVSSRRTSLMAGLALGRPVITNRGLVTGDIWTSREAVYLTSSDSADELARAVDTVLEDSHLRMRLSSAGQALHRDVFALDRGVATLRAAGLPAANLPRVLMFHTTLPTPGRKPGGVEIAVHRLANALVDGGVPITVASLTDAPTDARYAHRRLFARVPWLRDSKFGRLAVLPAVLNAIRLRDADVVHFHGDDWFVVRRPRATVRTIHGSAIREAQRATRFRRRMGQYLVYPLERLAARLATIAVAVGEDAAALHGIHRIIGNGVDAAVFHPGVKSETPTLLYVGVWDGRKRGRWMYDLFVEQIVPRHPTAVLRFVADEAPPPHPRVRFERFPDDTALATAYREAWVFALPSTYEGFGIPYLEAMSSGTAVLATPNTGAAALLGDGRFGVLAHDDQFAGALLDLLRDDDARERIAAAGLERSHAYGWSAIAQAYLDVYRDAIRQRHGRFAGRPVIEVKP